MTAAQQIDPTALQEMMDAARAMGVQDGAQNFKDAGVIPFNLVDGFSTFFAEWACQGPHILVHLFPRAGEADTWYEGRVLSDGRTRIPARREIKIKGLEFPTYSEALIKKAAGAVTFGDVELDYVPELGAWAVRFRDAEPTEAWLKSEGFLEQFFTKFDEGLEGR